MTFSLVVSTSLSRVSLTASFLCMYLCVCIFVFSLSLSLHHLLNLPPASFSIQTVWGSRLYLQILCSPYGSIYIFLACEIIFSFFHLPSLSLIPFRKCGLLSLISTFHRRGEIKNGKPLYFNHLFSPSGSFLITPFYVLSLCYTEFLAVSQTSVSLEGLSILSVLLSPSLSWIALTLISRIGPPIQKREHSLQHEMKCPSVLQKSPVFTISFPHHTHVNVLPIRHDPWTCEHISNFSVWLTAGAP